MSSKSRIVPKNPKEGRFGLLYFWKHEVRLFFKKSHWSKKRKTDDRLEFFAIQFVAENQNNQRGDSWKYQKISGKKSQYRNKN